MDIRVSLFLFLMIVIPITVIIPNSTIDCNSLNYGEPWVLKNLNTLRNITAYCSDDD